MTSQESFSGSETSEPLFLTVNTVPTVSSKEEDVEVEGWAKDSMGKAVALSV